MLYLVFEWLLGDSNGLGLTIEQVRCDHGIIIEASPIYNSDPTMRLPLSSSSSSPLSQYERLNNGNHPLESNLDIADRSLCCLESTPLKYQGSNNNSNSYNHV